jgi:hypothetical protein
MLDPADKALLAEVLTATAEPFVDPVCVQGAMIPRRLARHIERNLLRLRKIDNPLSASPHASVGREGANCPSAFPASFNAVPHSTATSLGGQRHHGR